MSRIGKMPIPLGDKVQAQIAESQVTVKGPNGELSEAFDPEAVDVAIEDGQLLVTRKSDAREHRSKHGLYRSLLANMVHGVTEGYEKQLLISGVGFRAEQKGKNLEVYVGFPEARVLPVPDGVDCAVEDKGVRIILKSADKQKLGQFAANIRRTRPTEPYKGKGVRYSDEIVRKKAGKTAK